MAASTLSLGMLAARAFCRVRRRAGLVSGLGPPAFTAMAMSLLMRVKAFAMRFQRANIVALRVSKMRPMSARLWHRPRPRASTAHGRAPGSAAAGPHEAAHCRGRWW